MFLQIVVNFSFFLLVPENQAAISGMIPLKFEKNKTRKKLKKVQVFETQSENVGFSKTILLSEIGCETYLPSISTFELKTIIYLDTSVYKSPK